VWDHRPERGHVAEPQPKVALACHSAVGPVSPRELRDTKRPEQPRSSNIVEPLAGCCFDGGAHEKGIQ
jgi:hypothetical protein